MLRINLLYDYDAGLTCRSTGRCKRSLGSTSAVSWKSSAPTRSCPRQPTCITWILSCSTQRSVPTAQWMVDILLTTCATSAIVKAPWYIIGAGRETETEKNPATVALEAAATAALMVTEKIKTSRLDRRASSRAQVPSMLFAESTESSAPTIRLLLRPSDTTTSGRILLWCTEPGNNSSNRAGPSPHAAPVARWRYWSSSRGKWRKNCTPN